MLHSYTLDDTSCTGVNSQEEIVRAHAYVDKAKLSPARIFKSPMDVVETNDIGPAEKLAILQAWEADERALLRAEDEGMGGGEHAHLHKVQAALAHLKYRALLDGCSACRRASRVAVWLCRCREA